MSLAPGDKVISVPTANGPVLVQVGSLAAGDKGVSIQTTSGPVFIPVVSLAAGDKVVAVPTTGGNSVLVNPNGAYKNTIRWNFESGTYTGFNITHQNWRTGTDTAEVNGTAKHGGNYGLFIYDEHQCLVNNQAASRVTFVQPPSFTGAWTKFEYWINVVNHYISIDGPDSLTFAQESLWVNGVDMLYTHGADYSKTYRNYNNSDALLGWEHVVVQRSEYPEILDTDTCYIYTIIGGASQYATVSPCYITVYIDDYMISY